MLEAGSSGPVARWSGSAALGSSAAFVVFAFLLVFAWPLKKIWTSQHNGKDIKEQKKDNYSDPGAVLKAGS